MTCMLPLIDELNARAASESSLFRAQLLREDAARLAKLDALARSDQDDDTYRRAARRLGWTPQYARTDELGAPLDALIVAARDAVRGDDAANARLFDAWLELTRLRMERLVGCLSTPVPKPQA